ncbi:MAG: M20/M25/M40 family metallo-hydrolase [Myxococcota bacterium]|jgi:acetylornithine deacetylase|nr:M20/M25/M40 family metallo-hydrolase [Myxococcota bacterium]MEC9440272.1 M20/M25/M40 family metallo-hydrolase [Myxococcota bacterium]
MMKKDLERVLVSWLEIDSVTPNERDFLEHLEGVFQQRGYTLERQDVAEDRWNLIARRGNPTLFYSTHVDTVPPFLTPRVEGNIIYGRGACDTKGGLLAMMEAADRLDGADVGFLLVVGEEVDHVGAKRSCGLGIEPTRIILCEPTVNRVVRAQKGMIRMNLEATGVAAHSAYPARGDSAIHRLLDAAHDLMHAEWPEDDILGPTTINIGQIEGGVAANVFAPSALANLLIRTVRPTAEYLPLLEEIGARYRVEVNVLVENDPVFFSPPEGVETCTVSFNTDATYLSQLGPVWLVGPGDIEVAHTDHEHIDIDELMAGIDLYEKLGRLALGI